MPAEYSNGPKGHQAPLHDTTSEGKLGADKDDNTNEKETDGTAEMLGPCRINSEGDYSDNVDVESTKIGVDINDYLVGATGVQLTEYAG